MRVQNRVPSCRVPGVSRGGRRPLSMLGVPGLIALAGVGLLVPFAVATAARLAFVTSASGPGILGQWSSAGGNAGLAAGDAICVALATAANLPEPQTFVAWLSDSNDDAYCRVHGFSGKKSAQCGQQSLPAGAGPWQRTDGIPFMGALASDSTVTPVYTPLARDEQRQVVLNDRLFTGTLADGTANGRRCGDWLVNDSVDIGRTSATYPGWTQSTGYSFCGLGGRLACLQKGSGNPLPVPASAHKQAFITSISLTGNIGAVAQAGGNAGVAAGDAICRNLAQAANLADAASFKVYLGDGNTHPADRFQYGGPWQRLDGVKFADSFTQIRSGYVHAPLNVTETGAYALSQNQYAWTGIDTNGSVGSQTCTQWSQSSSTGWASRLDAAGPAWPVAYQTPINCQGTNRLYCLSDSDVLFHADME